MRRLWQRLAGRDPEPLGARGERLAAAYLRKQGFRILERNLKLGDDEADLIALDPDGRTIVIVEVKTRASDGPAPPEESITRTKRHRLTRLAARLQRSSRYADRPFRFDAVAVVAPGRGEARIRHHPGAFEATI